MPTAISARQNGDDLQAYLFWKEVCHLLAKGEISRVGFETGQFRAFDDVAVEYSTPRPDGFGGFVVADHWQVKFSATGEKVLTAESLMDPTLIGADTFSLLMRLAEASRKSKQAGTASRFILVTPWTIPAGDALAKIHDKRTGALRFDKLFAGTTNRHEMWRLRHSWKSHLGLVNANADDELKDILRPFCIRPIRETLEDIRRDLSGTLTGVGLKPISDVAVGDTYSQIPWRLSAAGHKWFDRASLTGICSRESLNGTPMQAASGVVLGIRTFMRWAEDLEATTDRLCCLTHLFSRRFIQQTADWNGPVLKGLREFLQATLLPGESYRMSLQTHGAIAFAVGYLVDPKMPVSVGVLQRTLSNGDQLWLPGDVETCDEWIIEEDGFSGCPLAVTVSVSHDVREDAVRHIQAKLQGCNVMHARLAAPTRQSIKDGVHAWRLATSLAAHLQKRLRGRGVPRVHLFASAPNGFSFFLGRLARTLPPLTLYEFDFENELDGGYLEALTVDPSFQIA